MVTTEQRLHALLHGLGLSSESINKVKLYNAEQMREVGQGIANGRKYTIGLDRHLEVVVNETSVMRLMS